MGESSAGHVPVMANAVATLLAPALAADGAVLLDATLGRPATPGRSSRPTPASS